MSATERIAGRLAAWRVIVAAGIPRRAVWWAVVGSIGAGLAVMALIYLARGQWRLEALGIIITLGAGGLWLTLFYGLLMQNDPVLARSVPQHLTRLREVAGLAWVGMMAWIVGAAWLAGVPAFNVLLSSSLFMGTLAAAVRWPLVWLVVWAAPLVPLGLFGSSTSLNWFGSAAITVVGAVLSAALLGSGGDRHRRAHVRRRAWRRQISGERSSPGVVGDGVFARLAMAMRQPYHRVFDRSVARRSSPWQRLILGLGPQVHPAEHAAWAGLILGLVGVAAVTLAIGWPGVTPSGMGLYGPLVGICSAALSPVAGALGALTRTRREQALLVLLPGMPRGATLSRGLALRLWCHFGVGWTVASLLVLGAVAWFAPVWLKPVAACLASLAPAVALLGADLARLPAEPGRLALPWLLVTFGCPGLALLLHLALGVGAAWVAGGFVLVGAALLTWRWQVLGRRPAALPAGRLAA